MRNLLFRNESTLPATDSSKQSGNNGGATVVKPSGVGQSNGKKKKNKKPVKSNKNGTKTDRRSDRKVRDCGRKGLEDSSLELGNALPGEWPWHVS